MMKSLAYDDELNINVISVTADDPFRGSQLFDASLVPVLQIWRLI